MQTKISPMNDTTFNRWLAAKRKDLQTLTAAVMYCCDHVAQHGNKKPLQSLITCEVYKRANNRDGRRIREYCADLLKGWIVYNKETRDFSTERGENKQAHKAINWAETPSFLDFVRAEDAPKGEGKGNAGTTAAAMAKKLITVTESGFSKATVADLDTIRAALPGFVAMLDAAHVAAQTANADKAASVTDGATGDYSRNEAHADAADKMETATAEAPAPAKLSALVAKYHKGETRAAA